VAFLVAGRLAVAVFLAGGGVSSAAAGVAATFDCASFASFEISSISERGTVIPTETSVSFALTFT
jgi:hypothetical protein